MPTKVRQEAADTPVGPLPVRKGSKPTLAPLGSDGPAVNPSPVLSCTLQIDNIS